MTYTENNQSNVIPNKLSQQRRGHKRSWRTKNSRNSKRRSLDKHALPSSENTKKNTTIQKITFTRLPHHVASKAESIEEKFGRLSKQWRRETRHISSIHEKSINMAYQKIIGMGKDVLPYIFHDFEKTHDHWLWALYAICDEESAPDLEKAGDLDAAVDVWLNWARQHNYL